MSFAKFLEDRCGVGHCSQSMVSWVFSCAVAFCWNLNMRKVVAGFGSSLVLVKLGSGIKPLSPESKDNGPGGQQAVSNLCVL